MIIQMMIPFSLLLFSINAHTHIQRFQHAHMYTLHTASFPLPRLEQAQTTYMKDKQMDFFFHCILSCLYSQ